MKIIIQKNINVCTCTAQSPNKKRYVSCDKGHVRANFSTRLGPFGSEVFADVERDRASEYTFGRKFAKKIIRFALDSREP